MAQTIRTAYNIVDSSVDSSFSSQVVVVWIQFGNPYVGKEPNSCKRSMPWQHRGTVSGDCHSAND